jgi:hypothetical protein
MIDCIINDQESYKNEDSNILKKIVIVDKRLELLRKMLKFINISFSDINDLEGKIIVRDILLTESVQDYYQKYQEDFKKCGYKSGKLTSLHKNNINQKFPAINMLRQILKCQGFLLQPKIESIGYNKNTGQKLIKRYFTIMHKV